jgi:putative tricarboxylic transport membrane protein
MSPHPLSKSWFRFDPLLALLSIPIAVFLIYVELETPKANIPQAVGPEVMPIGILVLLIANAFFLFGQAVYGKGKPSSSAAPAAEAPSSESWLKKYQAVLLVLLGLIVYGFILVPIGFVLATTFLIIYEARLLQRGKWIRNAAVGFGVSVGVYLIFVKLLNVMLPAGILG